MFGCVSKPAARASVWNLVRSSGRERPVPSSLRRIVLTPTVRPITGSTALYTTPMAPRPSSPTISYLPAFVTVGIVQSLCRPAKTALATQSPIERIGFRFWKAGNLTSPQNFYRPFSGLDQRNAPPTPGTPYPAQYPPDFLLVNATGVPVFRTRYRRSVLPSGLSVGLCGNGSVFAPTDELGVAHRFPWRHGAFRHRNVGFADRTIDFAGPCGRFEPIRQQIALQRNAVGPNALERRDVFDLQFVELPLRVQDARIRRQHLAILLHH